MDQKGSYDTFSYGNLKLTKISDMPEYSKFPKLISSFSVSKMYNTKWIKINGNKLKPNNILVIFTDEFPAFHLIQKILVNDDKKYFYIITKKINDVYLNENSQSYIIYDINDYSWCLLDIKDILNALKSNINKDQYGYYHVTYTWV